MFPKLRTGFTKPWLHFRSLTLRLGNKAYKSHGDVPFGVWLQNQTQIKVQFWLMPIFGTFSNEIGPFSNKIWKLSIKIGQFSIKIGAFLTN